jgi:putative membrane fusion protein
MNIIKSKIPKAILFQPFVSRKETLTMRKNKEKTNVKKILILFLILIIVMYSMYSIIKLIQNPTDTCLVENGKISFEESTNGYVIRDETVIKGENYKNGIDQIKTEGEKVAKNDSVFRYYTSGEEELEEKIKELDVKIQEVMENENALYSNYSSDIKTLEEQIQKKIYEAYEQNDLQKVKEYKKDLNTYITKKAKIAGEKSPSGSYLKQLIEQRSEYENQLNSGSEYINAPVSGIVSYRVDGLENVLTTSNLESLTKEMLEELKLKTGQIVSTSNECGKIINNFYCYIACVLKNENLELVNAKVGSSLKIRLSSSDECTATIEQISQEDDEESLVILKIYNCVEELINYRKISLDIIWWSESGLKVPNTAIKYETEDLAYIVRKRVGYTDNIYIKILKQNDTYAIIKNYTETELKELGVSEDKIKSRRTISLYDELEI